MALSSSFHVSWEWKVEALRGTWAGSTCRKQAVRQTDGSRSSLRGMRLQQALALWRAALLRLLAGPSAHQLCHSLLPTRARTAGVPTHLPVPNPNRSEGRARVWPHSSLP